MIKYRVKAGEEGRTYMGKFYKQLKDCTQAELKEIFSEGNQFIEKYDTKDNSK